MPRRALLIGAQTGGLTGVAHDLDAMDAALRARGFAVERRTGEGASRAGILAAYGRLIGETGPEDSVVVYYSGHGGRVQAPEPDDDGPSLMDMQFIVPTDFDKSTVDDFRGITSVELSMLADRLTRVTPNVTVVLDCCHAAHLSRDPELRIRALADPVRYRRLRAHIDRIREQEPFGDARRAPAGNPNVVRVVACAPEQSAFEYQGRAGVSTGLLTESLTMALAEAGAEPVSWATIMRRVQQRVLRLCPSQRPEAEGPSRRLLFDTAVADTLTTLPVTSLGNGRVRLDCAPLLGVRSGDEFMVMPADAVGPDPANRIGDLTVNRLAPLAAEGQVVFASGWPEVPVGARAHRTRMVAPAVPVRLQPDAPRIGDLAAAVAATPLLRLAEPDERWLAQVRLDDHGRLTVSDRRGPLGAPRRTDDAGLARVLADLKLVAQAAVLRELATATNHWAFGADLTIELGTVHLGRQRPLGRTGGVVHVGDRMYVRVRNDGPDTVYVSLIDIGVASRIGVLSNISPSGVRLAPGRWYAFGYDDLDGVLCGEPLYWPDGLEPVPARPETLLVLVSSAPQDVTALEQEGITRGGPLGSRDTERDAPPPTSPLEQLLDQAATGRTRDMAPAGTRCVRYDVHALHFELSTTVDSEIQEGVRR